MKDTLNLNHRFISKVCLEIEHRVFDKKLEETNYKYGYRFSGPHEYDEVLKCESTEQ